MYDYESQSGNTRTLEAVDADADVEKPDVGKEIKGDHNLKEACWTLGVSG